jgi:hypothetical protein
MREWRAQIRDLGDGAELVVIIDICNYQLYKAIFWQNKAKLCNSSNGW